MLRRSLALAVVPALALPASALAAAAEPGSYRGASVNKEIYRYGDIDPRTDKGKVSFSVKKSSAIKLKLSGQEFMCGASPAEIPVSVAKIKLNSAGKGQGTYTNENVGSFEVAIKVGKTGRASGTITPEGLCRGVVKFTAKHR
jgi:hypothetical protein